MTCDDVRPKLPLYLTGDLPAGEAEAVRTHLDGCPGCRDDHAELAAVRAALDAVPAPAVPAPDVAAIYRAALDCQLRSARRWKRAAAGAALLAAGLLGLAILPRLEVRLGADEFAVRWGPPPPVVVEPAPAPQPPAPPAIDSRLLARVEDLNARARRWEEFDAELRSLKDLLLTLAADVGDRDRRQRDALAALVRHLRAFEAAAREQFRQTEETNTALYTAIFDRPRPEGGKP